MRNSEAEKKDMTDTDKERNTEEKIKRDEETKEKFDLDTENKPLIEKRIKEWKKLKRLHSS